ncbi:UPF0149 family protein [Paraferrimonas sp. SM1919]|uniref:UPF0149 family protein n=1 Tax=Paraferrimonas sp. SM1919 TaxID=2662263 RepID=UPI0013D3CD08|nr:UPF0149 family protein [Paraferrimonas sp. SM1919]
MSLSASIIFKQLQQLLQDAEMGMYPIEVQATLAGIIAAGTRDDSASWQSDFCQLCNDGQPLPSPLQEEVNKLYQQTLTTLTEEDFAFNLLLQDDDDYSLSQRLEGLALWVQAFLTALAVAQPQLNQAPAELKEMIDDLGAIAQVEIQVDENEEGEVAYTEVTEYVKVVVINAFHEFNHGPEQKYTEEKPTLH